MKKKLYSIVVLFLMCLLVSIPAFAAETETSDAGVTRSLSQAALLVDDAGLLDSDDASALQAKLEEISANRNCDVVIVTTDSLDGKTAQEYADDYFDYNGYGYGASKDGIILVISMSERKWAISTHGSAITAFTDEGQSEMVEQFKPYLSNADYAGGFNTFADLCDNFLAQAAEGDPYDVGNTYADSNESSGGGFFSVILRLIVSFLVSLVPASIATGSAKSAMNTVAKKEQAHDYIKKETVKINRAKPVFLRKDLNVRAIPKSNDDGGGSSVHESSSGEDHGGSSGDF